MQCKPCTKEHLDRAYRRLDERELNLCLFFNRACRRRRIAQFFAIISRLGDGIFWYALIGLLPLLYGYGGLVAAATMVMSGTVGVTIYKLLKAATARPRPFASSPHIRGETQPLDEFSFPSGHTLHSTCFTIIAVYHFPELAWVLMPFAALVAISRVVLGLHYPSDVLVGLLIGTLLGLVSVSGVASL